MKHFDSYLRRTKSVLSPSAQTFKLCEKGDTCEGSSCINKDGCDIMKLNATIFWYIYKLQESGTLRISEVLSIKVNQITSKGNVLIKGAKGSHDKFVESIECQRFLIECKRNNKIPFEEINRYQVYRVYKKYNINIGERYGGKQAITHGFRYKKAREIEEVEKDMKVAQRVLGHKNINSTSHYVK